MEALMPILTTVGSGLLGKVGGNLVDKLFGGGTNKSNASSNQPMQAAAPAVKNLFSSPDQIKQATDRYTQTGTAKWNQILANMGAGGGTGGPDVATQIGQQANQLGTALGMLNTDSGYGSDPTANMDAILKGAESGIGAKYAVY
jgi:hypothetical protein